MKVKFLEKTIAFLKGKLSLEELPMDATSKELSLSEDQRKLIEKELGPEMTNQVIDAINIELKDLSANSTDLKAIQDELDALVKEHSLDLKNLNTESNDGNAHATDVLAQVNTLLKDQKTMINELLQKAAGDSPEAIIQKGAEAVIKHSKTHLFSSGLEIDAFEGRNWNMRAAGLTTAATDFTNATTIEKLNGDMELYFRENPEEIKSLQFDKFGLPEFWGKRTKVDDQVATGTIVTAEVSQGRKLPWLPKNKQKIEAETGKIYPVQIDIEFVGYFLQQIETSWLNSLMNKEGSQPYKMNFVRFLLSELDKKARVEDRIASIKGVYVKTPEDAKKAGRFINRQNGLLYLAQQARDVNKKYRPFDLGAPTAAGFVDYVDNMIKRLPEELRTQNGIVFYLSTEWLRTYKREYERLHGLYNNYEGYPTHPKDYANIKFQELVDLEGSDFMFITFDDNIEILENVPAEKSLYKFEYLLRTVYIWADYKLGIRFITIGTKIKEGDPLEFQVQTVWSNNVPIFPKVISAPFYENTDGELDLHFTRMVADSGITTAITKFTGGGKGQVIKIVGNTAIVNNVNITTATGINSNFNLKSGGELTVFVKEDGTYMELARTTAPEVVSADAGLITSGTVDANDGVEFKNDTGSSIAITNIINGVEGKTIKIVGPNVTLSTTGNVQVTSNATLANAGSYVNLTSVGGKWIETKRNIQA
nr:hypothetical protein [uncultured Flavobacterium sp.]